MASYADARAHGGHWLVRMEDLDRTREAPGASDLILRTLEAFGFQWDETIIHQSRRTDAYQETIEALTASGLTYPCGCSRADIARSGAPGIEGPVYPGTCRTGVPPGRQPRTIRLRTSGEPVSFHDRIQGHQIQNIAETIGDFVLRRADGIHAYQLAVVVDDAWQGITHVVRGADLLLSAPRQIMLQRALKLPTPEYAHVPLAVDAAGKKLSKSLAAAPADPADPLPALQRAWTMLGQVPLHGVASISDFWLRAIACWRIERVPPIARIAVSIPARP